MSSTILKTIYLKSAVFPKDYPEPNRPEVALAGRSNSGKSSFLNAISNSKIAHVSQQPGKTRLLNFFDFGKSYRIVDMPGYGYASRSGSEMKEWSEMIQNYLVNRENLRVLVLLMDARRAWSQDEELLKEFTDSAGIPMVLILTKKDKCSKSELSKFMKAAREASGLSNVFAISTLVQKGAKNIEDAGFKNVETFIFENWIKNYE